MIAHGTASPARFDTIEQHEKERSAREALNSHFGMSIPNNEPLASPSAPADGGESCKNGGCYWYVQDEASKAATGFEYTTSITQPLVSKFTGDAHSIDQLAAGGGAEGNQDTMEAGFTVDHVMFPSAPNQAHFFIYVNADKYKGSEEEDCYDCHFVPLEGGKITPGEAFEPTYTPIRIAVKYYNNSWWIFAGTNWIGYVPEKYWSNEFTQASHESVYGEVFDSEEGPTTQMGNGLLGNTEGAATMTAPILYITESKYETTSLKEYVTNAALYSLGEVNAGRTMWHYGGPGVPDPPPSVTDEPATEVTASTARLNASVVPNFGETTVNFELGLSENNYSWTSSAIPIGSGGSPVGVWAAFSGLGAATTYHYRLKAVNDKGTTWGADESFTTLPVAPEVTSGTGASGETESGEIWGEVNPRGTETHYQCEYGTSPALGTKAPEPAATAGTEAGWKAITCKLKGLLPNKTYYFRVTAWNSAGTMNGATNSFTTEYRPVLTNQPATGVTNGEATMHAIINPEGHSTTYKFLWQPVGWGGPEESEEPIGEGTTGVPVSKHVTGLKEGVTYNYYESARNSVGGEWDINTPEYFTTLPRFGVQATPNEEGATNATITGISCATSTACIAVANFSSPVVHHGAYALKFAGTGWTYQAVARPEGADAFSLNSVSCSSHIACTAVGSYNNPEGIEVPLVETWNGTEWSVLRPPVPAGATSAMFESVSCVTKMCAAVGSSVGVGGTSALTETSSGSEWKIQPVASLPGANKTILKGVSCSGTKSCVAVGASNYTQKGYSLSGLIEKWNGTEWSSQHFENPYFGATSEEFSGVSCSSSASCMIVGSNVNTKGETIATALSWKNKAFGERQANTERGATNNKLIGVACWGESECVAAGDQSTLRQNEGIFTMRMQERVEYPVLFTALLPAPREHSRAWLRASECLNANECWVGGAYATGSGETVPFIEAY